MNMHQWQLLNIKDRCIITMSASCSAVYCNWSCLWVCVCLWVCYHNLLEIACIDPHQTGFVGKGSDHLQLIKFWLSRAPGKGVCGGVKIFGSTLLQPACSVCISLTTFSFDTVINSFDRFFVLQPEAQPQQHHSKIHLYFCISFTSVLPSHNTCFHAGGGGNRWKTIMTSEATYNVPGTWIGSQEVYLLLHQKHAEYNKTKHGKICTTKKPLKAAASVS